ncbi:MAG: hypothetical protein N2690_08800, partial [Rhodocyclaceae bacterium]|nr:hypothetical protein [Rhodocyclaceae bacterium]
MSARKAIILPCIAASAAPAAGAAGGGRIITEQRRKAFGLAARSLALAGALGGGDAQQLAQPVIRAHPPPPSSLSDLRLIYCA